ncbi:SDR family NAD(P)-dependent oxidoreductase [Arthrobacter crystallopoietes]|uniref:SDR family NAD(P)-dependent oxidoreductase n=1 Tax=Crystallibacter crystallopoietes TaxID=37928 RepID=UPI000C76A6AF|nr:SDR family NAD(P)-dependent oxidoreductase [Arthrobacter crystallopoietes]AUI50962.1 oxidoreductase [Arthrobacter crystallopoietes]
MTAPKTIVITGASDGIGAAAAQILHAQGDKVVLVGRSPEKTEGVAEPLGADWFTADFQDLHQVRTLAKTLKAAYPRIDVLANNAGGLFAGPERTSDGFEKTFQVNHLAPFLLTHELLDVLLDSRASIVNTSSIAAKLFGRINIDDLNTWNGFTPNKAYGNSKLANILFTRGLHQRYSSQGLSAVAFHPGNVATNFAAETTSYLRHVYRTALSRFLITPERGGANLAYFCTGTPGTDWESGRYYSDRRRISRTNPQAADDNLVRRHWEASAQMLGLPA